MNYYNTIKVCSVTLMMILNLDSGRLPNVFTDIFVSTRSETAMEHTGSCTSAWRVRSGNLNISGIYGAESRYGGAGRLL